MKTPYTKYILHFSLCIAVIVMPPLVTWCCGPVLMADESRFALFRQGLDNDSGLKPFHYSEGLFNFTEADPEQLDYKRNCKEWSLFCGNAVTAGDIYEVQYNTPPSKFEEIFKASPAQKTTNNAFINWLSKKQNSAALAYMLLAKAAEQTQRKNDIDPWDTTVQPITVHCNELASKAANALSYQLPVFLKERYAFQAIKMYYYSDDEKSMAEDIEKIYKNYLAESKSIVAGWSMVYVGMKTRNLNQRTAFLLNAFDKTEEKKEFCYLQISNDDLSRLEKTTTDHNLLVLTKTLAAVKNKGRALPQLMSVYKYDPDSKYLPLLITREINKLENWLWSPEMLYFYNNYRPDIPQDDFVTVSLSKKLNVKDKQYLKELRTFIEGAANKNTKHHVFLQLALAHIYALENDFDKANMVLQRIKPLANSAQETQRLIEQVIITAHLKDINNASTQQQLADYIENLTKLNPVFKKQLTLNTSLFWESGHVNKSNACLSELFVLLSHCFEKKKNTVLAGLLYNRANITINRYDGGYSDSMFYRNIAYYDRSANPADIDILLNFKHKKNKTPFEKLIAPKVWGSDDNYKDLQGTILFRQKKYKEALAVFKSMSPDFWHTYGEFKENLSLTSVLHTGSMIPSEKTKPAGYRIESKLLIVKDIVDIQNKILAETSNEAKAYLYYQLANAYFNTSYNGKTWMMFSYGKSSGEKYKSNYVGYDWASFNFSPNNLKYADYYYCCSDAIATYKKAMALTNKKEFSAKCLLALSACDIIRYNYLQSDRSTQLTNTRRYIPDYLRKLKAGYSDTDAYAEAAIECPDVKNL